MSWSASTNAAATAAAPWAELLPELCDLVVDRLDAISILRFPAACAGWSAACKDNPRRLRCGSPALLTSGLDPEGLETEHDVDAGAFALHDVVVSSTAGGRRSFLGDAAGLKGRTWIGGKGDWLVTTDYQCDVELLNPVTGDRFPLPSFDTTRGVEVKLPGYLHVSVQDRSFHRFLKVTLCRTPAHPSGYLAVAVFSHGFLAYTADGDEFWTALNNKNDPVASGFDVCHSYMDAIVVKGKLFAVTEFGLVYSWDMTSSSGGTTEPPAVVRGRPEEIKFSNHYGRGFYLAASSGGQLLLIYVYGDINSFGVKDNRVWSRLVFNDRLSFDEVGVSIHELDAGSGGAWRRVADIGEDRALFLGANYPFYITVPLGSEELKANCIYVADTPSGYDVGIFDLNRGEDGLVERLDYSLMADALQMPMWFRPTAHPRLLKNRCP